MGYRNLQDTVADLERHGQLIRIDTPVDPHLEAGAIQRRVYQAQGPALLFTNVIGSDFPLLGNLFGTLERARFLFRGTLATIRTLVDLKLNPMHLLKHPEAQPALGVAAKPRSSGRVICGSRRNFRIAISTSTLRPGSTGTGSRSVAARFGSAVAGVRGRNCLPGKWWSP